MICPQCTSARPLEIVYGFHSAEMISAERHGEIALSGAVEDSHCPAFRCRNTECAHEWGTIEWQDAELPV
jgi:hypothetical protein